jgi:hypothetical protein
MGSRVQFRVQGRLNLELDLHIGKEFGGSGSGFNGFGSGIKGFSLGFRTSESRTGPVYWQKKRKSTIYN